MSKKKNNRYVKNAAKKDALHKAAHGLDTKHNVKNTLLETGKNLVVGVIGGGLAGAAIGKSSLLVGLAVTGLGHYFDQELATMFGIGVMAANGFQKQNLEGFSGMDGVKERVVAYKDNFAEKLFIHIHRLPDKKGKGDKKATDGLGAVQFFNYRHDLDEMKKIGEELKHELNELDNIEKQIESSGLLHMHKTGMDMDEVAQHASAHDEHDSETEVPQDEATSSDHIL